MLARVEEDKGRFATYIQEAIDAGSNVEGRASELFTLPLIGELKMYPAFKKYKKFVGKNTEIVPDEEEEEVHILFLSN